MNFVVQHAIDNVWAEEIQDKDFYIRPARITPNGGSLKYAEVGITTIGLPNVNQVGSRTFYHVYHIGQLPPNLLGVDIVDNSWVSIDEIAQRLECFVNVYLDNGFVIPRGQCRLLRTWPSKNILLCIEYKPNQNLGYTLEVDPVTNASNQVPSTLNNQGINIRFYTNARYFATDQREQAVNPDNQFFVETDLFNAATLNRIKANKQSKVPQGWFIVGGKVHNYNSVVERYNTLKDQEISVVRDESVIGIEYFKIKDLPQFVSSRNRNVKKYIVNLATPVDLLVYHNDVEYFLGVQDGPNFQGLCIPSLRIDPITTITNKSHAIRTDVITDLMSKNNWLIGAGELCLMVVIRQGGMLRGLIHQNTRIEELFKLPNDIVESTLTGVNSLVNEWRAVNLEVDDYAAIVEARREAIVEDMVFNAYGYNGITRYHHPNPLPVTNYTTDSSGVQWYNVQLSNVASARNPQLPVNAALIEVLEYDRDGLFIGRKRTAYANGGMYISNMSSVRPVHLIEHYINSVEDNTLDLGENFADVVIDNDLALFGFAAYITTSDEANSAPIWVDVTKLNNYYYLDDYKRADGSIQRRLTWNTATLNSLNARGMVRINNRVCFKTYNIRDLLKSGRSFPVITIPLNSRNKVPVEPGQIDLWMEDRLLIEGIDYVVKWPNIYIGRRVTNVASGKIQLRLSGLANPETREHEKPREVGFVKGGILSVDKHYDIRNDRNIQINVGGALKHRDEVSFDEDQGVLYPLDGRPYQIRDYITPIEMYTNRKMWVEKLKSEEMDTRVMRYLNQYLTTKGVSKPTILNTRWLIVSVFLDDIIGRLLNGWLNAELSTTWTATQIETWLSPSKHLLSVDVSYFDSTSTDYIRLIPHGRDGVVSLTERQYMFIDQVCKLYLKDKVQLNNQLAISV